MYQWTGQRNVSSLWVGDGTLGVKSSKAWDQVDGGVEAYISFSHSLCEPTSHQRTCGTGILKSWKARHPVTSRPTSPVVTGFVCHETKAAVFLLALSRLKAVRLCIRSALHQIKRLIHPQGLTSVAGCPSVCLSVPHSRPGKEGQKRGSGLALS